MFKPVLSYVLLVLEVKPILFFRDLWDNMFGQFKVVGRILKIYVCMYVYQHGYAPVIKPYLRTAIICTYKKLNLHSW
jgi:hypothetical protein